MSHLDHKLRTMAGFQKNKKTRKSRTYYYSKILKTKYKITIMQIMFLKKQNKRKAKKCSTQYGAADMTSEVKLSCNKVVVKY